MQEMQVINKHITAFKPSILNAYKEGNRYIVIEQAGACDLKVEFSERELNSIYSIL